MSQPPSGTGRARAGTHRPRATRTASHPSTCRRPALDSHPRITTSSATVETAVPTTEWPIITAGVCAPAVKDFATVRNRLARTIEDAQPMSLTVMTYSEPSSADFERVLETAPQECESPILRCLRLRVDHVVQHQVRSTTLADLPTCSDSSRRSCREQMAGKRSGPRLARARRLSRRRGCGTTAGNSGETDRPPSTLPL